MSQPRAAEPGVRLPVRLTLILAAGMAIAAGAAAAVPAAAGTAQGDAAQVAVPPAVPDLDGAAAAASAAAPHEALPEDGDSDAIAKYLTKSKLDVYFARRSVELTPEAMATIAENAERLKSDPGASVTLVGYTDEVGSSSYGVALAQRRASVVAEALVGMGVDSRQIRSTAYGQESDPAPCATDVCRTAYRRVAFRYLKPQTADLCWPAPRAAVR